MSARNAVLLGLGILAVVAIVAWIGAGHSNEARAFLRGLAHSLH